MNLYNFNKKTGLYTTTTQARMNPMYNPDTHDINDKYLYNNKTSTLLEPPECSENEVQIFEEDNWVIKINNINKCYYEQNGTKNTINDYGVDIPEGSLEKDPLSEFYETHDGTDWILDESKKNKKIKKDKGDNDLKIEKESSTFSELDINESYTLLNDSFKDVPDSKLKTQTINILKNLLPLIL